MVCICIDLKSFYASVACVDRGLDPLKTNLLVADERRSDKTICLAVSPPLKILGIPGRPRLFEAKEALREINRARQREAPGGRFTGKSFFSEELQKNPALAVDTIIALPQMRRYMDVSRQIYEIYLRFVAPEDIHVYSVDEVFIDATPYLTYPPCTPRAFATKLMRTVLRETGITATAGIGTNLYLAKIAMDILAKKAVPDKDGARLAELDEMSYREKMWDHRPITDFWRIGHGYARRLAHAHLYTMGDIARCSLYKEDMLYHMFGINAELLIDHAWGYEPCTLRQVQAYRPANQSLSQGQVLPKAYSYERASTVVKEMVDALALDLTDKGALTNQVALYIGFDGGAVPADYEGPWDIDHYGRRVPKSVSRCMRLSGFSCSRREMIRGVMSLYRETVDRALSIRRIGVAANHVLAASSVPEPPKQLRLFSDEAATAAAWERERRLQKSVLSIQKRYGKNAILRGMDLTEGATAIQRNGQVGGHSA